MEQKKELILLVLLFALVATAMWAVLIRERWMESITRHYEQTVYHLALLTPETTTLEEEAIPLSENP